MTDRVQLRGRTVLITGGTSGIGRELARQLLARGNTVIVTGRDAARLAEVKGALPGLHTLVSDVSSAAAISALHDEVVASFPALDVLINNAGIMRDLNLNRERSLEDVTQEIDINLSGPVRMAQRFLPQLKKQKAALLVNVSSGLAFIPMPMSPVYCATKAAVHSFTQSLRVQLEGTSVRVVELVPPLVETPLFTNEFSELMPGTKGMDVGVLGRHALEGIEAGKVEIRPGQANLLKVMSRLAPSVVFKQLAKVGKVDPKQLR